MLASFPGLRAEPGDEAIIYNKLIILWVVLL